MENNVKKIYLCSYGENTLDLPVVDYNDYEELHKQLQQAKAELEQYKKSKQASYEAMQDKWNKAVLENRELKAENEELKENLAINKDAFNSICVEKYKLEECLDEIEAICDFNYTKENTRILANEILQLIKQAKEGNNG